MQPLSPFSVSNNLCSVGSVECGTRSTYVRGCRCADCRDANAVYIRNYKRRPKAMKQFKHGGWAYFNHRCRCEECVGAVRARA